MALIILWAISLVFRITFNRPLARAVLALVPRFLSLDLMQDDQTGHLLEPHFLLILAYLNCMRLQPFNLRLGNRSAGIIHGAQNSDGNCFHGFVSEYCSLCIIRKTSCAGQFDSA